VAHTLSDIEIDAKKLAGLVNCMLSFLTTV